ELLEGYASSTLEFQHQGFVASHSRCASSIRAILLGISHIVHTSLMSQESQKFPLRSVPRERSGSHGSGQLCDVEKRPGQPNNFCEVKCIRLGTSELSCGRSHHCIVQNLPFYVGKGGPSLN